MYSYVTYALHRIRMLQHYGVRPYVVFDGGHLPSKQGTERERAERREQHRKRGLQYMACLLYTSPSPRDLSTSRMPSSA